MMSHYDLGVALVSLLKTIAHGSGWRFTVLVPTMHHRNAEPLGLLTQEVVQVVRAEQQGAALARLVHRIIQVLSLPGLAWIWIEIDGLDSVKTLKAHRHIVDEHI